MKELKVLTPDAITEQQKQTLMLLACDERGIRCHTMPHLKEAAAASESNIILAMPDIQYQTGLRGRAKAHLLAAVTEKIEAALPLSYGQMQAELETGWGQISIPTPLMWNRTEIIRSPDHQMIHLDIQETSNKRDIEIMERANKLVETSNCWLDPAACIAAREGDMLVEGVSSNYNQYHCTEMPVSFKDLELNIGERMIFCDSLHAERVAISQAAASGASLEGATIYVTKFPCRSCALSLIAAKASEVIFDKDSYGLAEAGDLLAANNIIVRRIKI